MFGLLASAGKNRHTGAGSSVTNDGVGVGTGSVGKVVAVTGDETRACNNNEGDADDVGKRSIGARAEPDGVGGVLLDDAMFAGEHVIKMGARMPAIEISLFASALLSNGNVFWKENRRVKSPNGIHADNEDSLASDTGDGYRP